MNICMKSLEQPSWDIWLRSHHLVWLDEQHLCHVIRVGSNLKFARLKRKKLFNLLFNTFPFFWYLGVKREWVISHGADEVYVSCLTINDSYCFLIISQLYPDKCPFIIWLNYYAVHCFLIISWVYTNYIFFISWLNYYALHLWVHDLSVPCDPKPSMFRQNLHHLKMRKVKIFYHRFRWDKDISVSRQWNTLFLVQLHCLSAALSESIEQ